MDPRLRGEDRPAAVKLRFPERPRAMREPQPKTIYLKDYTPPAFRVESVELDVDIRDDHALVRAQLAVIRLSAGNLVLDGDEVELVSVAVDGRSARHEVTNERLTVYD